MPAEVEERMFERFVHRGDLPLIVGSVGLGLAISKMLAEGMGGRIAYRRTENHTIFEVTLQTAERPASEPSPDWLRAADVAADAAPDLAPGAAPDMVDVATTSAGDSSLKSDDDNESATQAGLAGIALSDGIRHALEVEGVSTIEDLLALSEQDLLAIEGIGSSSLRVIERSLAEQDSFPTEA